MNKLARRFHEVPSQLGAVGVGSRDVRRLRPVIEAVLPSARAVDELVGDDELAEPDVGAEGARCVRPDDPADSQFPHRPHVGAVRDAVWRQLVVHAVPWEERDALASDVADGERGRRAAVRRIDLDALHVLEERVETRAAEDADICPRGHARRTLALQGARI